VDQQGTKTSAGVRAERRTFSHPLEERIAVKRGVVTSPTVPVRGDRVLKRSGARLGDGVPGQRSIRVPRVRQSLKSGRT
jgi:hypothetical protein